MTGHLTQYSPSLLRASKAFTPRWPLCCTPHAHPHPTRLVYFSEATEEPAPPLPEKESRPPVQPPTSHHPQPTHCHRKAEIQPAGPQMTSLVLALGQQWEWAPPPPPNRHHFCAHCWLLPLPLGPCLPLSLPITDLIAS